MLRFTVKKPRVFAYKVKNVCELDMLEKAYKVSLMNIPAIYVFDKGHMKEYEIEEEQKVKQVYECEIIEDFMPL